MPTDLIDLVVVMPVYNEEAVLAHTVESWLAVLDDLGVDYRLLVLNDGSRDGTGEVVARLADHPRVEGITKQNEGHGPTILRGYRDAVQRSAWVFQVDSDDEMPATSFTSLWAERDRADAVFGYRTGREQTTDRKLITRIARLTTRLAYGCRLRDVNTPYRLMRAEVLAPIVEQIPADTFAPNVVISGALARTGARVVEVPVPHVPRSTGEVSIIGMKALKAAARSFLQSIRLARRFS
ncbi:MAG: glycosyltransferase family 2 protein [Acidimicrobiales bacterium]|nr:glycosyltransferase family 2 protein [Acidimicrobiales bacterium]